MKKILSILLILVLVFSLAACGSDSDTDSGDGTSGDDPLKVVLLINGTLGDLSFFDSAHSGLEAVKEELGDDIIVETVEMTKDETKWLPTLYDYSDDGSWDIIIAGTWHSLAPLEEVAPQYPDQKYFMYDETMNYETGEFDNVYSIRYKQNEVSFVAGALAAMMTTSEEVEKVDPSDSVIGFLGGADSPVVNDFLIGYIEGAKYVDEDIRVVTSYVGNFNDTPKGKDLALAQYQNQGVDIGFNVAGLAGLGQIDAAVEADKLAIGVDSDQALIMGEPEANHIPTSALKKVGNSIQRGINLHLAGEVPYGEEERLGFEEDGVALAKNKYYEEMIPEEIKNKVEEIEQKIADGEIEVSTSFGMTNEEIQSIIDSVK